MEFHPVLFLIVATVGCALFSAYVLKQFGMPAAIAYILTGLVIGPSGLNWVHDVSLIQVLGELGVIMLLFFIGMEVSLPRLLAGWRIAVLGTLAQMLLSVAICTAAAFLLGVSWRTGLLFGFIISMSSTAVVLTMLKDAGELDSVFGQNALGVLLMQDLAIVPIMIIIGLLGGGEVSPWRLSLQLIGGLAIMALAIWLMKQDRWSLPKALKASTDKQVMLGLLICFASASVTSAIGLSAPLGAFLAGMILHAAKEHTWVEDHLRSLYVVFVAVFFISVGLLVDLDFALQHLTAVILITLAVFALNSGVNTLVLRLLGEGWRMALLTGALLSQIGELSFLLAAIGLSGGLLDQTSHQMVMIVIALTLMLSPLWMLLIRRLIPARQALLDSLITSTERS
ncbi:MAG: cation:proton antiporter [Zetaproteobacteria bacterium]|nr:MAG: cation:proton antiporter [Zetaproteobacteria bacterium]